MKRWLFRLGLVALTLTLFAACAELMAILYFRATAEAYMPARLRFAGAANTYVDAVASEECTYLDTLYPHPYLAFVHHGNPPCGMMDINNVGLFGADFPFQRPTDRFVLLLTGGSVAAQFASGVDNGPSYLERLLNERYVSPTGRPFQILNGGDGAWKQPQQAILLLLYADVVHAVVTLDGFNEHYMLQSPYRFEYPANNFHSVNPLAEHAFADVVARWSLGRLHRWAASNVVLSRSHAAYALVSFAERYVEERAESQPRPNTSTESIFATPSEWTPEQRKSWAISQYQKYVSAMDSLARDGGLLAAYFVQPTPAIGKTLTPAELRVVGDLQYGPRYQEMTDALVALNQGGTPVVSLLDVFAQDERTLYGDAVHLVRGEGNRSAGYESMADRMATELSRVWHLRAR